MATIRDVAKAAGVSAATVSNVINGKSNMSEATRARVLRVCEALAYPAARPGKGRHTEGSRTILFSFSEFNRNYYPPLIQGISDYVGNKGYDLMICSKKAAEKYMNNSYSCGCIVLTDIPDDFLIKKASREYPIVVLDRTLERPYIKSVGVNNYSAMCEMMQSLVDRGYRHFSFLAGPESAEDNRERFRAFSDTLEKNNIFFRTKDHYSGDFLEKSGYTAARIILLSEYKPEVLVCANDEMAIGAIKAFRAGGVRVPDDIAVTGFDDNILAEAMGLTTISVPEYECGYLAAQYLVENLQGRTDNDPYFIAARVIWRSTVKSHVR